VVAGAQREQLQLTTATDGNHGRAVARMAKIFGIKATVFVPNWLDESSRSIIASEGAVVVVADGDYDLAVQSAFKYANQTPQVLLVQDTSFQGYEEIPWVAQLLLDS